MLGEGSPTNTNCGKSGVFAPLGEMEGAVNTDVLLKGWHTDLLTHRSQCGLWKWYDDLGKITDIQKENELCGIRMRTGRTFTIFPV